MSLSIWKYNKIQCTTKHTCQNESRKHMNANTAKPREGGGSCVGKAYSHHQTKPTQGWREHQNQNWDKNMEKEKSPALNIAKAIISIPASSDHPRKINLLLELHIPHITFVTYSRKLADEYLCKAWPGHWQNFKGDLSSKLKSFFDALNQLKNKHVAPVHPKNLQSILP